MPLAHKRSRLLIGTYLTHEELFGRRSLPEEFRVELSRFPSDSLLRICSGLNILLFGWSPYLDKDLHDQLVGKLCPAAYPTIKRNPFISLLHRQGLLLVAKEVLRRGPNLPPQPASSPDMTRLFTMANDQLVTAESPSEEGARSTVELISRFLPVSEFQFNQSVVKLSRAYVMLSKLSDLVPKEGKQFNIPKMFEERTGLPPEIYFPLVMACMAKYSPITFDALFQTFQSFALRLDWFGNTVLDEAKLLCFFGDLSADYAEFKRLLGLFDRGVSDFTIFRERPILRLGDCYYPIDFGFLAAKSESALFWRAQNSLPEDQRKNFHAFWGAMFERYMHRLLKQSVDGQINRYYESPRYSNRDEEVCDGIMVCKGYAAVFLEFKGSMFRADAKWSGNSNILERELRTKLVGEDGGDRKGVTQLANAISNVFEHRQSLIGLDLGSVTTVYSMLVTYDEIGGSWFLTSYLNEIFRKTINKKTMHARVTPLFCASGDHLEAFAHALNRVALSEILQARYRQEPSLKMPFWLPSNAALKGVTWAASATAAEGSEELLREARRLFPNVPSE